jgi:AcrR family transcriptional regulator
MSISESATPTQPAFRGPAAPGGLRPRKKLRTRIAIQDAAMELFAERGYEAPTVEEICVRAEVSTTTFFRYFRSKGEVFLEEHGRLLPALESAIVDRPTTDTDLEAVRHAMQEIWIPNIDPERTVRQTDAIATSHVLRGVSYDIGQTWFQAIARALARRHDLPEPDRSCLLMARVSLSVFSLAMGIWRATECRGDLAREIDEGFDLLVDVISSRSRVDPKVS